MPAAYKHPSWWNPNGHHKHTVNNTFEKISNSKPSVRSRRLTSFHRFGKPKGAANRRAARKAICEKSFDFLNRPAYNKKHRRCLLLPDTPCGGNPTVATNRKELEPSKDEPSNDKPSVSSRRLTSYPYRTNRAREKRCSPKSQWLQERPKS